MSTRCNIEIYDFDIPDRAGVMLYHHYDGHPSFMFGKLKRFLNATYKYLKESENPEWWDSERVGAVLIALSIEDYSTPLKPFSTNRPNKYDYNGKIVQDEYRPNGGVPVFQPCLERHGDIDYIYRVDLKEEQGKFTIKVFDSSGKRVSKNSD